VLLDQEQRVVLSNRAASTLLSVPPQQMRGIAFGSLIPLSHVGNLLADFHDRRTRVVEILLPLAGRKGGLRTLSITAMRLARAAVAGRGRRPGGAAPTPQEFRLLLLVRCQQSDTAGAAIG
jgi:hypothetical protein